MCSDKLRQVMHRCLRQSKQVLAAPTGTIASLVPLVIDSLVSILAKVNCINCIILLQIYDIFM